MYVVGGFDGTRLNDMYHIALPGNLDTEELTQSVHRFRPSSASNKGSNEPTEPSESVVSESMTNFRWDDINYLRKKVTVLQK